MRPEAGTSAVRPGGASGVWGQPSVVGRVRPEPAPIGDSARRLLEPLVGVDAASVRVYRGPEAGAAAAAQAADAFTVGDAVVLGAGASAETPETLGLLAHELTHVARSRQPRFIPPIIGAPLAFPTTANRSSAGAGPPAGEEGLARLVEGRVRGAAQRRLEPSTGSTGYAGRDPVLETAARPGPALGRAPVAWDGGAGGRSTAVEPDLTDGQARAVWAPASPTVAATASPGAPEEAAPPVVAPRGERASWGSLPAPWDPLPDWLAPPPDSAASRPSSDGQWAAASAPDRIGFATPVIAVPGGGIQRAEEGRQLAAAAPQAAAAPAAAAPAGSGQPEPDLDALARQVYSVLRRRLEAERRRAG